MLELWLEKRGMILSRSTFQTRKFPDSRRCSRPSEFVDFGMKDGGHRGGGREGERGISTYADYASGGGGTGISFLLLEEGALTLDSAL